jgi:hypothetical protein
VEGICLAGVASNVQQEPSPACPALFVLFACFVHRQTNRFEEGKMPCGGRPPHLESGVMPKKKRVARPRVLWQVNPTTQVVHSARRYERTTEKKEIRKTAEDEQER